MKTKMIILLTTLLSLTSVNAQANYCYCDSTDVYKEFSDVQALPGIRSCVHFVSTDSQGIAIQDRRGSCLERYWPIAGTAVRACTNHLLEENSFCK